LNVSAPHLILLPALQPRHVQSAQQRTPRDKRRVQRDLTRIAIFRSSDQERYEKRDYCKNKHAEYQHKNHFLSDVFSKILTIRERRP
jgi:hypothetical protein